MGGSVGGGVVGEPVTAGPLPAEPVVEPPSVPGEVEIDGAEVGAGGGAVIAVKFPNSCYTSNLEI